MALPLGLSTEVTSIEHPRKRKHSDAVLPPGETPASAATTHVTHGQDQANGAVNGSPRRTIDDDSSEDDRSLFESIIDQVELEPFISDGSDGLAETDAANLRALLRRIGVGGFVEEILASGKMPPRIVGIAFGVDPNLPVDEQTYLRILGLALVRAQYKRQKLSKYNTIDDAAQLLQESRKIMVITGAGISTSLGIPDFRSKGTGFYEKLRNLGYEDAEEVFEISNFDFDPSIFFSLAGDILPDQKRHSPTHAFIRKLQDKDRLQTNYTQNIDNIEALAGIDETKLIQCHGSFATATCRKCKHKVTGTDIFPDIREKRVAQCGRCREQIAASTANPRPTKRSRAKASAAGADSDDDSDADDDIPVPGVMKPDITFFGEQLPDTFFRRFTEHDAQATDLVIVIGTSLKVAPVSEMPNYIPHEVPHIFISREPIEHVNFDIQLLGNCDDVVFELCRRAGWEFAHDMIPDGFATDVLAVDGCAHRWVVVPKLKQDAEVKAEGEEVVQATTSDGSDAQAQGTRAEGEAQNDSSVNTLPTGEVKRAESPAAHHHNQKDE